MFTESLLESAGGVKTRQRWTSLLSLSLEALVIGVLVLIPLLQNQALPRMYWTATTPVAPPPRGVEHPGHGGGGPGPAAPINVMTPPTSIPSGIDATPDAGRDPAGDSGPDGPVGVPWGVEHGTGPNFVAPPVVPHPPEPKAPPRVSIVTEGNVVYRVLPVYPAIAKQIGAQGAVVLHAVVSKEGKVESLRVVSSAHPLLNQAALDAVQQWRFRPYLLNGVPVEVEAQITVNFLMPR